MDRALMKRLEEVAAAYGADPARWPPRDRTLLEEAARASPEILAEAAEIDRVLAIAAVPRPSPEAQARLVRAIAEDSRAANVIPMPLRRRDRSPAWSWATAATLAASLACGIYLGTLDSLSQIFDPDASMSDDPVDLAGLGDVSDYLEDEG